MQEFDADSEKDENEEAVESERNCTLDNIPNVNNTESQREFDTAENLDDQEIIEVNKNLCRSQDKKRFQKLMTRVIILMQKIKK